MQLTTLLTIPQTAAHLQCSIRSVRRLIETGALPSVRIGKLVRVDPGDLAVLIHSRAGTNPAQPSVGQHPYDPDTHA